MVVFLTREQVASFLYNKRRELGLRGQEVSDGLKLYGINISKTTIYGYENGVSSPTVPTFLALCRIYDAEDSIVETDSQNDKQILSKREQLFLQLFNDAPPGLQDAALRVLQPTEKDIASGKKTG